MSVDPKLTEALKEAVANAGQPAALARKLVAWLEAVTSGNEDINDVAAADRHLEFIYAEVKLAQDADEDDLDDEDDDEFVDELEGA